MKVTSYFCDLCGSAIPTELVDDVKGLNIRVDLDGGYLFRCFWLERPPQRNDAGRVEDRRQRRSQLRDGLVGPLPAQDRVADLLRGEALHGMPLAPARLRQPVVLGLLLGRGHVPSLLRVS